MGLGFTNSRTTFLAVSGILLLFCFQQFILYYSLYYLKNVTSVLYVLILDVPLGLYIFFGLVLRSVVSSIRYSILWCMYSITIVVKMIFLAFLDESYKSRTVIEGLSNESNDVLLSFFGFYVTPIVFSLFNSASKASLFQDGTNVSVDELLHSDLGLSTTIDLWDLILMFSHLLKYYKVEMEAGEPLIFSVRIFVVFIIFVLITIFLLGLVIPTVDGDYKVEDKFKTNIFNEAIGLFLNCFKKSHRSKSLEYKKDSEDLKNTTNLKSVNEGSTSLDMFTMAKFTFIIGFFLIDIPFLSYRLYILIKYNVFSLLLYKNFIFLFLRPYRLNMSQLAERDTAKGWQTAFFNSELLNVKKTAKGDKTNEIFGSFEDSESESDTQLLKRFSRKMTIRKKKTQAFRSALGPKLLSRLTMGFHRPFGKSDPVHFSSKLFHDLNVDFNLSNSKDDQEVTDANGKTSSKEYLDFLDDEFQEVDKHSYKMYVLKILRKSKMLPVKSFPTSIVLRQWQQFLFSRVTNFESNYVSDVNNFNLGKFDEVSYFLMLLFTLIPRVFLVLAYLLQTVRSPRHIISNFSNDCTLFEKVVMEVTFGCSFILVLFFLYSCQIFDSILSFLRDLLNLYSLMVCLHSFKTMILSYSTKGGDNLFLLFIFFVKPLIIVLSLFNNLVPRLAREHQGKERGSGHGDEGGFEKSQSRRKLLNLKLVYILVKYTIGPISLNNKLCSSDLVETFKIHDSLLHAQWSLFVYSFFLRLISCCSLESKSSFLIVILDLFLFFLYNTTSQSIRALMFRKYEVNFIVMRILRLLRFDWDYPFDTSENSFTFADIDKYIKVQGLLSSPGAVITPFI